MPPNNKTLREEIDYRLKDELGDDVNFYEITDDILKIFEKRIDSRIEFVDSIKSLNPEIKAAYLLGLNWMMELLK